MPDSGPQRSVHVPRGLLAHRASVPSETRAEQAPSLFSESILTSAAPRFRRTPPPRTRGGADYIPGRMGTDTQLDRQALLADGADGESPGGPAQAGGAGTLPARRLSDPPTSQRLVRVAGRPVRLTATEFELLRVLSVNAGRVLTYEALLRQVWGGRDTGDSNLVRAFVKKLRRKLGDDTAKPAYVFTERGAGYRMPGPSDS